MLIRDLERATGLDRATIRFYEREGLITPERGENGYRTYTQEDRDTLLKIKLLRQLDMPLEKIKELQRGSADLGAVLAEQIRLLEARRERLNRAMDVCAEIRSANASYDTLDAAYYLDQLSRPAPSGPAGIKKEFKEPIQREYHPIRRFVARMLDYRLMAYLLEFLMIVVLRIRPFEDWLSTLITYATYFLMVPLGALMLHLFGTTPGKWCLGLGVESEDGGHLSFGAALEREWEALRHGYGFGIPFWSLWRLYRSYKDYDSHDPDWDWKAEYSYQPWKAPRKAAFAGVAALLIVLIGWCTSDLMLPKYRGDLTVAEFSANFNHYITVFGEEVDRSDNLQPDGSRYPVPEGTVVVYIEGQAENERSQFGYETEGEYLRRITYSNRWTNVFYLMPLNTRCQTAAITAAMSQPGMSGTDLLEFVSLLNEQSAQPDGHIEYRDVEVNWHIDAVNCNVTENGMYYSNDENAESCVTMDFEILIK